MTWYTPICRALVAALEWLRKDYNWVWVLLFPLGAAVLAARVLSPSIRVISGELFDADVKADEVRRELADEDAKARADADAEKDRAQEDYNRQVSDLIASQEVESFELVEDQDELTKAMIRAGKSVL